MCILVTSNLRLSIKSSSLSALIFFLFLLLLGVFLYYFVNKKAHVFSKLWTASYCTHSIVLWNKLQVTNNSSCGIEINQVSLPIRYQRFTSIASSRKKHMCDVFAKLNQKFILYQKKKKLLNTYKTVRIKI